MKKDSNNNNLTVVTKELKDVTNEIIRGNNISISADMGFKHKGKDFILEYKVKSVKALRDLEEKRSKLDSKYNKKCHVKKFLGFGLRLLCKVSVLITSVHMYELFVPAFEKIGAMSQVFLALSMVYLLINIVWSCMRDVYNLDRSLK